MIATTLLTVIEKWYSAIPKIKEWENFELISKVFNYKSIDIFTIIISAAIGLWIAFSHGRDLEGIFGITTAICTIFIGCIFFWKLANKLTEWGHSKFMSSVPSSSICITEGDKQLIEYSNNQKSSGLYKLLISLLGSIITAIISKLTVAYLITI